ncbi:MAG: hypothetical protein ACLU99_06485 [Alphaproteobacteria bacterium]
MILASIGLIGQVFQLQPVGLEGLSALVCFGFATWRCSAKKPFCRWYGFRVFVISGLGYII